MAVTLNVEISDSEQQKLVEVAADVAPNATPAQIKVWAEKLCKDALRTEVRKLAVQVQREAENEARKAVDADWRAKWADSTKPEREPEPEPEL